MTNWTLNSQQQLRRRLDLLRKNKERMDNNKNKVKDYGKGGLGYSLKRILS